MWHNINEVGEIIFDAGVYQGGKTLLILEKLQSIQVFISVAQHFLSLEKVVYASIYHGGIALLNLKNLSPMPLFIRAA